VNTKLQRCGAMALLIGATLAGCESTGSEPDEGAGPPAGVVHLPPELQLVRASMALRGERPSVAELRAVREDPAQLPEIVDQYLDTRAFGAMMRDLHNESLQVRVAAGIYPAGFAARGSLAGSDSQALNVSVTEAPLRLIEHVITHELPYTEIVTADYTVADGAVAQVWGIEYDGDGKEWRVGRYLDGRPHAGVLSDSMLFTRHSTTYSNGNRGRANAVARGLLCYDFLSRDITIDATINLADPAEVANAVRTNTTCASCHQTLDPLAAYFGAFHPVFVPSDITEYPFSHWLPSLAQVFTVTDPGYFGYEGGGLEQLGQLIAQDPRFSLCAAKRFYSWFHQSRLEDVPLERATELQHVLVASDYSAKALARAVVLSEDFMRSHAEDAELAESLAGLKKVRPAQLALTVRELTGFDWETDLDFDVGSGKVGRVDLLADSLFGFEVLAGGIDSVNVTLPAHTMTASASLVLRALAAHAAPHAVELDFARSDRENRRLLTLVSDADVDETVIRSQLAELELRFFGAFVEPSSDAVTSGWQLFSDALAESNGDVRRAWTITLFAMLQDVRIAHY
jgi:hypothetical protein